MSSLCFTYKSEYLQIKQSSGGTGFSGFFAHFVYICIFWNLYIFHLLAYCMFILNVFGYWHVARILILISKQFQTLWPGFRHFRGKASLGLSSVCVCVHYLLVILSVSSL